MALITLTDVNQPSPKTEAPKRMMSVEVDESGHTTVKINNSSLNIIMKCLRYAHYALDRNIGNKYESPATIFGTAIHEAFEVFYSAPKEERILPKGFKKNFELLAYRGEVPGSDEFLLYRAVSAFIERAAPLANLDPSDKRSIHTGVWLLAHYFETYIDDPYTVYVDEHGPVVERLLEREIYSSEDLTIVVFGTIDVVLQNLSNGQILVCDHKTSSIVGRDFYNRLKPNHQYTCYTWLAQKELGLQTDKFLVNCLQVKAIPKTSRGTPPQFPRQITTRTEEDVEDFRNALVHHVRSYLRCKELGAWPTGPVESCTAYGGCTYLQICSSPNSIKENIIEADYLQGVYS